MMTEGMKISLGGRIQVNGGRLDTIRQYETYGQEWMVFLII